MKRDRVSFATVLAVALWILVLCVLFVFAGKNGSAVGLGWSVGGILALILSMAGGNPLDKSLRVMVLGPIAFWLILPFGTYKRDDEQS